MYIEYEDVIARYEVIKTWGKTPTEVNSDLIYYAEMELNSRLASHFSVPFSAAHPTVKDLAIDLCYLKALRTRDPKKANDIEKAVLGRIDALKEGREYIYTGSGTQIVPEGADQEVWSTTQDYHPVHGILDAEHEDVGIDDDRIEDEEDERD